MSRSYILAIDLKNGKYINKEGTYTSAANAMNAADSKGSGFKVYLNGKVYYEQECHAYKVTTEESKVCDKARTITSLMYDVAKKGQWYYSNSGCAATIKSAISSKKYKSNCATLANWIFRSLKITGSGQYFYGKAGSVIQWRNKETETSVKEKCKVIKVGKTVSEALKRGILVPGDVCLYAKQHTNVYSGNGKWFESGTVYANGSGAEGTVLKTFFGNTVLSDWVISYIIRYNDPGVKEKRAYRVQLGAFSVKKNATALANKVKNEFGIDTLIKKVGKNYIVQAGQYDVASNAIKAANKFLSMKLDCQITGI